MSINCIDSRDIVFKVEAFESDNEDLLALLEEHGEVEGLPVGILKLTDLKDEYAEYLEDKKVNDEGESTFSEWASGVQLIPESEFPAHCQELVEEVGDMPRGFPDYIVIDWDATAENLKADYSSIEIDGVTYLGRG